MARTIYAAAACLTRTRGVLSPFDMTYIDKSMEVLLDIIGTSSAKTDVDPYLISQV